MTSRKSCWRHNFVNNVCMDLKHNVQFELVNVKKHAKLRANRSINTDFILEISVFVLEGVQDENTDIYEITETTEKIKLTKIDKLTVNLAVWSDLDI